MGVQLLSRSLHSQIFKNVSFPPPPPAHINIAHEHLNDRQRDEQTIYYNLRKHTNCTVFIIYILFRVASYVNEFLCQDMSLTEQSQYGNAMNLGGTIKVSWCRLGLQSEHD